MSKKTLNQANLETLGAQTLAALLMEISTGSADIKRRLRLELSHQLGPAELTHDVRKRLASLRKSTSYVSWRKRKALIKDLQTQVTMITDKIAPDDPAAAFDVLWQFIEIAPSVYGRVDDSRGEVGDVFRGALEHFEEMAPRAGNDPEILADRVWTALQDNDYGQWDGLVARLSPALGPSGLARLKSHLEAFAAAPPEDDAADHEAIRFLRQLRGGDSYAADRKARFVKARLQEIATVTGDTAAYIAQYSDRDLERKDIAAQVAGLLLEQNQPDKAHDVLQNAQGAEDDFAQEDWDNAFVATLVALDQPEKAQAHRWACFEATLNADHLRAHLKHLPDFEDVEAEDAARRHALAYPDAMRALTFCMAWPDLLTAAHLIEARPDEMDGNAYHVLVPAAEALRTRHPLAAVLLWRALVNDALYNARTSRYAHAADHLADCARMDELIEDYGPILTHDDYLGMLWAHHPHKSSFWAKVP